MNLKIPTFQEVKEWANNQGWVTESDLEDPPVESVNNETGAVTVEEYSASKVESDAPVSSVNNETGAVTLDLNKLETYESEDDLPNLDTGEMAYVTNQGIFVGE